MCTWVKWPLYTQWRWAEEGRQLGARFPWRSNSWSNLAQSEWSIGPPGSLPLGMTTMAFTWKTVSGTVAPIHHPQTHWLKTTIIIYYLSHFLWVRNSGAAQVGSYSAWSLMRLQSDHGQHRSFRFFTFMSDIRVGKTNSWRLDRGMLRPLVTHSGILWARF